MPWAIAALPRSASASGVPIASSRRSTSVSTRLMKKLATLATRRQVGAGVVGVLLETGDVGLHHLLVAVEAEDQVTLMLRPSAIICRIGVDARGGGRDLHHQVAPLDLLVQVAGGGLGARRVVGELGSDLDARRSRRAPSVTVVRPGEHVAGAVDVGEHHLPSSRR